MGIIEAFLLGLIQGLTEFLPVSSSGHIELGKALFGVELKEGALLFTLVLHFATAISTIVVFWKDLGEIVKGLLSLKWNDEAKFSYFVVISMIPAVLVGMSLKDWIDDFFEGKVLFVGSMLLLTGLILYISDKVKGKEGDLSLKGAIVMGLVQAIAIMPGISRSGSTIATGVIFGVDRVKAARFSFIMVLPLILGAMAAEVVGSEESLSTGSDMLLPIGVGFVSALVSGYFACKWMIEIVKRSQLKYFSYYCWAIGVIAIVMTLV